MGPERTPRAPEVLVPLADQWQRGGYDIRWLYRTVLNTQAYQRRVRSTANAAGKTPFAAGCPSRLRADQMFEALAQSLGLPLDGDGNLDLVAMNRNNKGPRPGAPATATPVSLGDPKRAAAVAAVPAKKGAAKKALEAAGLPAPAKKAGAVAARGGPRAAFERLFGVDPSVPNDEVLGTIPQALFMMNSPLINARVAARPGTVLAEILAGPPDDRAALGALYLRVLSRHREAFEDIYWSLINSTEFLTRR